MIKIRTGELYPSMLIHIFKCVLKLLYDLTPILKRSYGYVGPLQEAISINNTEM